jgi:GDP-L-fucose synthase
MNKDAKIFIAGHNGLVGSAIYRHLKQKNYTNLIVKSRHELDLTNQEQVNQFFKNTEIDYVYVAAAKVGGIYANYTYPADFGYINGMIELNILNAAMVNKTKKLLFLGSNCIYPRECPQPIKEEYLISSDLEKTNELYALAKILGVKMCEAYNKQYKTNFISGMPCNLYGPFDNFHPENSHLLPSLIRKIHEAKEQNKDHITIWGTGAARREILFSEDVADACEFLMDNYVSDYPINIGYGTDYTIIELFNIIKDIIGYKGSYVLDSTKPDGTMRKLLDVSKLNNLGWKPKNTIEQGIEKTYKWFLENKENHRT